MDARTMKTIQFILMMGNRVVMGQNMLSILSKRITATFSSTLLRDEVTIPIFSTSDIFEEGIETDPLPKPTMEPDLSSPKFFKRTSFAVANSQTLDPATRKGVNYIIGQIILYWPCGDEKAVQAANLSLVTGHSFYHEQFKLHLERLKNLELRGKSYAPFEARADGVSVANYFTTSKDPHIYRSMVLSIFGTR
jgi:hypothetical protein